MTDEQFHTINRKLDFIFRLLLIREKALMATLKDIQDEIAAETSLDTGLLVLINKLVANQNDPVALQAILTGMQANIAPLAAALQANTGAPAA
jgi:hypothetical protein